MLDAAYTAWRDDQANDRTSLLIAPDTATVTALNARAHDEQVLAGHVHPGGIQLGDGTTIASGNAPGKIALVTREGQAGEVAGDLAFPNGMVVTPDNATLIVAESFARRLTAFDIGADGSLSNRRLWAEVTGDGICMDADGAVWCSDVGPDEGAVCLRVREGGEVLDRIEVDRPCYACMLGGEDGRTLFMVVAKWFGPDRVAELVQARTGAILTARVSVPHAGWP